MDSVMMFIGLIQVILVLWIVTPCESDVCSQKFCQCTNFGRTRVVVKCQVHGYIPNGIPSNTIELDLSNNLLRRIPYNTFKNMDKLEIINLADNLISGSFYLPESVSQLVIKHNFLSSTDAKVILKGLKRLRKLDFDSNPLGPTLPSDMFAGFSKMDILSMRGCHLEDIENGTFRAMKNLTDLDLSFNNLTHIHKGTVEGLTDQLTNLYLDGNELETISDGTFKQFKILQRCTLRWNNLTSVPDLTGPKVFVNLKLDSNRIKDISRIAKSGIKHLFELLLASNEIDYLPPNIFQNIFIMDSIDLSFNKLQSIPDGLFNKLGKLQTLMINFNNISNINNRTFEGLSSLKTLMLIKNKLTFISNGAFDETALQSVFLHSNAIKTIGSESFSRLNLKQLTIFDNPLHSLPDGMFDKMDTETKVSLTCKNLLQLPKGQYQSVIDCAPSTTFHILLTGKEFVYIGGLKSSGFECHPCKPRPRGSGCRNCSLCQVGYFMNLKEMCVKCPAGGFYQDEMGQLNCKRCSIGTFVSETRRPGTTSTDCVACPYGTLSNETAKYRACRCLQNFYRLDRFGPCSACPLHGFVCEKDTAILAPNFFWKWSNQSEKELFKGFVNNIHLSKPDYDTSYSTFNTLLPKPLKCPYAKSCEGGIDSECHYGYKGVLCATCSKGFYFRFHTCLKCPRLTVTVTSSILVISLFVAVFLMVLWGDSKRAENNRTVADVVMSCFKIVIGFYQVIAGIFSALAKVQWPVILISTEKVLKVFEGNILQFAPLSCIHSSLRLDELGKFTVIVALNVLLVGLIFLYLFVKRRYIINTTNRAESQKIREIKSLKKSCYRNIFLLLLTTYPTTSKSIIQILPLPGACVETCFSKEKLDCIFLLRADYSIQCFTPRHSLYWLMAAILALYPVGFPLLALFLTYKYRESHENEAVSFGLRVFFENYKKKFWFWEVIEMYRKLILISLIFLFGSKSLPQIGLTVLTVSVFGVLYTLFRPIKDKFEDRLQTFVLWIIFFDVCLGAVYTNWDESQGEDKNDSIFVNVLFVVLNASVLLFAIGKGISHVKLFRKYFTVCPMRRFNFLRQGLALLKNKVVTTTPEESCLIEDGT
ncbi:uncharacterized protein [Pocillopora verrucosa]|uniref:uncharacterized protein isoform X3 n=1 Tax=Pocillopora verrucosa TaxID=203993 RepID=UPI0033401CD3